MVHSVIENHGGNGEVAFFPLLMWLPVVIYGLIASGFVSLISHPLHLFLPGILIFGLFILFPKMVSSISLPWFSLVTIYFFLSLASATFGEHADARSWFFVVFTVTPLYGLAIIPSTNFVGFLMRYAVTVALAICIWIFSFYLFFAEGLGRWQLESASGSGNLSGAHLNMVWPVIFGWAVCVLKIKWQRRLLLLFVFACIVGVLLSFSRMAFATAIGLGTLFLYLHQRRVFLVVFLGVVPLAAIYYWESIVELLELYRLVNFEADYPRTMIWEHALTYSQNHLLFGASPGGAEFALSDLEMYHAHNNVVNTLLERGVIAGLLMAVLSIFLVVLGSRCFFAGGLPRYVGCGILSYVAYSTIATPIEHPELTLTLMLLVGASRYLLAQQKNGYTS